MTARFIPFILDIAPDPYGGGSEGISPIALAILIVIIAAAVAIGIISLVKAVKSEKKARAMQESAGFAAELLNAIKDTQTISQEASQAPAEAAPEADPAK